MEQFLFYRKTCDGFTRKLWLLALLLLWGWGAKAQCPTGDVTLYSQAHVNNFATNYPNCTEITGFLYINGITITDLSPLSNIQSIGGFLEIGSNSQLTNLDGLSNLTEIGGDLTIQGNSQLTNLDGLSNLTSVGGYLSIYYNSNLTNLDGLSNLTSVGADLVINSNYSLTDISGLQNIDPNSILSSYLGVGLYITGNPLLSVCNLDNFCTYLAGSGARTISNNAGDCISEAAVNAACSPAPPCDAPTNLSTSNVTSVSATLNWSGTGTYDIEWGPQGFTQGSGTTVTDIATNSYNLTSLSSNTQYQFYVRQDCTLNESDWVGPFAFTTLSQCPTGDVILGSQADVNAFGVAYPNCTQISGSLHIQGNDITDLSPLSNITNVGGYLAINFNPQLTGIDELDNLVNIAGFLAISGNPLLTNLDGLINLESIGGDLNISNNADLEDISGLQNIDPTTIQNVYGFGLYIVGNTSLSVCNLENFCTYLQGSGLRTISGNAGDCISEAAVNAACTTSQEPQCPTGNVTLTSQADVNNFATYYPNCTEITGYLYIGGSTITDLSPLSNIQSVGGLLEIYNTQLTNLDGLSNLTQIGGYLKIQSNSQLTNLDGLSNLTQIGGYLNIYNNSQLTNLDGLSNLTQIGGYLLIESNYQLTNLDGLSNLTQIGGRLYIYNNSQLTNLDGLSALESINGDLLIYDNAVLTDISGLQNIDPATILPNSYGLHIQNNPLLSVCNLDNFCTYLAGSGLRTISNNAGDCVSVTAVTTACTTSQEPQCPTGDVALYSQADVNNFATNYPNCTEITGSLHIGGSYNYGSTITDLSPLNNIQSIGGFLEIGSNSQLTNLDGLSNLTQIGGYLEIYYNSQLTNLDGLSALESINGDLAIYTNAVLTDISGLQNIDSDSILSTYYGVGLYITGNPLLSVCNLDNFCTYLAGSGPRTISQNAGDCISVAAVNLACNPVCDAPNALTATATSVSATLGWTSTGDNFDIEWGVAGFTPGSGTLITDITTNSYNLTSLSSNTQYQFYVRQDCTLNQSDWVGPFAFTTLSQCPTGDVILGSQAEVDAFATNYPNCTEITGYLQISGSIITDLSPLSNIQSIGGDLYIYNNYQLTNLDGLSNLTQIGGDLSISSNSNSQLTNLDGLSNLTQIGGYLYIVNNSQLTNLDGLSNLTQIGGYLGIQSNAILENLDGLSNLTEIGGYLNIQSNSQLTNLDGLSNLTEIGGYLNIQSNSQLTNLDGLSALESINGDLVIYTNAVLTDISGLQNIDPATISTNYGLRIQNNPLLSVCNLDNFCTYLAGSGLRTISNNAGDCVSVTAVTTACTTSQEPQCPTGDVGLYSQADVNNFATNYPNCTEITGYLYISGSDITDLSPLSNIQSVGGFLLISSNSQLTNLDGLSNLTQIGGYLYIYYNSQLTNLDGLSNLTQIGGYLNIVSNSQLTNLDGLSNLTQIGGDLYIQNNAVLENLDGLSALESINGDLVIYNNAVLTDISGLQNIDPATILPNSYGLYIRNNPLLSVCNLDNFCTYLAGSGARTISNNAGDCVSVTAVTTACTTSQEPQCPTGDVTLFSQADVNNFATNYPNCTEITGYLYISGSNITDLSPLSNIQSIGGFLYIYDNSQLTNLDGLSNLTQIGGYLLISVNSQLTNLDGLIALESINGDLLIYDNPVLTDISGLQNIDPNSILSTSYGVGLYIQNNPLLSVCNMDNFCTYLQGSGLRTISGNAGDCISEAAVNAACNPAPPCDAPANLTVSGIINNKATINWTNSGTFDLKWGAENFTEGNELGTANTISALNYQITGLIELTSYDVYVRQNCTANQSEWVKVTFNTIAQCPEGSVELYYQADVNNFATNYPNCTEITGFLYISGSTITDLSPLSNIQSIGGFLEIVYNSQLTNLDGLSNLTQIGGYLEISSNSQLTNLDGLSNLTSIGADLVIYSNSALTDISGLQNIDPATILPNSYGLDIRNNPLLSVCNLDNFCTYLAGSGLRTISGNAGDCISVAAVNLACNPVCENPTLLSATNITTNSAELNWSASGTYYDIEWGLQGFTLGEGTIVTNLETTTHTINSLDVYTQYEFYVLSKCSNIELESEWVGPFSFTTLAPPCEAPTDLSTSNMTSDSITLNWTSSVNLFDIQYGSQGFGIGQGMSVTNISDTSYTFNDLTTNAYYDFYVRAKCTNNESEWVGPYAFMIGLACPNDDVILNSQTEVNDFIANYPSCTEILGDLIIQGNDISDLSVLSNLAGVNGDLRIQNTQLTNLHGLHNLSNLEGDLYVYQNDELISFLGSSNLTSIQGDLYINENSLLENLSGLSNIIQVSGAITITDTSLLNLNDLSSLTSVGEDLLVNFNSELLNLNGLNNLTTIGGYLDINNNSVLENLNGLSGLTTIEGGKFYIEANAQLTNIVGLHNLNFSNIQLVYIVSNSNLSVCHIENLCIYLSGSATRNIIGNAGDCEDESALSLACGSPIVIGCPDGDIVLTSQAEVDAFATDYPYCTEITGSLTIGYEMDSIDITNLSALSNITSVGGSLNIFNTQLTSLEGLSSLMSIEEDLQIWDNWELTSLFDHNLASFDGYLDVRNAAMLESLSGFANTTILSGLSLDYTALVNLEGLSNLTSIGSNGLYVAYNILSDFSGLNNLTTIGGSVYIADNYELISFDGLNNLTSIVGTLNINWNTALSDISALSNIDYTTIEYLEIFYNLELSECSLPSFCAYFANSGQGYIVDNAGNCMSVEDVENACAEMGDCNLTTIWNGTSWSNGEPTITTKAIIDGALTLTSDIETCELEVTANGSLTIPATKTFTVKGQVVNNSTSNDFVIANNGILLQIDDVENQGMITVERASSPMYRLDYTIWSSPVSGMLLKDLSNVSISGGSGTLWNRVYTLGDNVWNQVWASQQAFESDYTSTFAKAKGYMYRAKNAWVTRDSGNPGESDLGVFTGVPNNGTISINTPLMFNAIGNPYPSPIDGDELLGTGVSGLYFWTNANVPDTNGNYQLNNWAYYTQAGGTGVQIGGIGDQIQVPNGIIQPGQGFVAGTTEDVNQITFNNEMRMSTNGSFFRQMSSERHRFWLNLSDEMAVYNQILVGYMDNATQGVDSGIDAAMFAYEGNAIYSVIENSQEQYVIQGRELPFADSDVVKLGFRAIHSGNFSISLNNFDGIFEQENLIIYLKDSFNQTQHNLKNGAYAFLSEEGMFDNRFEVVYQTTMSTDNPNSTDANWIVYRQDKGFQVQTIGFEMKEVEVYDILGRAVYTSKAEGTTHHIPVLGAEGVFIVKVTTTEDKVLNKKVR